MPRSPWHARGLLLVRRTSSLAAASPSRPTSVSAELADVVRECLLLPPQPGSLHVAHSGVPEEGSSGGSGRPIASSRGRTSLPCGSGHRYLGCSAPRPAA